jgi:DNA polymerase-4
LQVVPRGEERALLAPLPIRRLWGIGPVAAERFAVFGIHTIGDLADYSEQGLLQLGGERALQLQRWARGEDDSEVVGDRVAKSCGEENTFGHDVSARDEVTAAITSHAETVAARLRAMQLRGRTVTVKIKLAKRRGGKVPRVGVVLGEGAGLIGGAGLDEEPDYPVLSRSKTLPVATDDGKLIRDVALRLWDDAKVGEPIRLIGVTASNLESGTAPRQLDLFGERRKADALGPTLDEIQKRFGKGAIRRAVDEPEKTTLSLTKKQRT